MQERFTYLLDRYYQNQASPAELEEFYTLVDSHRYDDLIRDFMDKVYDRESQTLPEEDTDRYYLPGADRRILHHALHSENDQAEPRIRPLWPRFAVAASILFLLSVGGHLLLHQRPVAQVAQNTEQIAPVQNGITLTLAQGRQIQLNTTHNGQIASTGNAVISQVDSTLHYQGTAVASTEPEQNTLTNNSNTKFSISLADGSVAVLDIGSSLTYPVAFNSKTHEVSLSGQGYFKVKHYPGQRFLVKTKGQVTEDIGTEFNINAYADEAAVQTTLIAGSIKVNDQVIRPGQQAIVSGPSLKVETANIEAVTSWLQGKLIFEKEPLENILKRVSRIYGVQFVYQDETVRKLTYGGSVSSTKKLSSVLNFFRRLGGVDFTVEGKTVKVFKTTKNK